jgi:hypothetical protein
VGLALAIALVAQGVCAAMASAKSVGENFHGYRAVGLTVPFSLTRL